MKSPTPEAVAVLVVERRPRAIEAPLVAGREDALPVDLEGDRGGEERVPGKRVHRELVLVPRERLAELQDAIDRDRIEPEARKVVAVRLLEDRRDVRRRPHLGAARVAQQVEAGDVVVVVVRRDHRVDLDVRRATTRAAGRSARLVVAEVDPERAAVLGEQTR